MKIATNIAGGLLGFVFAALALMFLLKLAPMPPPPAEGTPPAHFMAAFMPTGYMTFVKVFEVIGGILVAIPLTRNWGLLVLGPIIINILAFNFFVGSPQDLLNPMIIVICLLALFLLWAGRKSFIGLLNCPAK